MNLILLVFSPCGFRLSLCQIPSSLLLSVYICVDPPPFLSSPAATKTYCMRTCQPVCPHNGTVHGSDKQFRLNIVRVYDRQRRMPLSTETRCPRRHPPPLQLLPPPPHPPLHASHRKKKECSTKVIPLISTRIQSPE